MPQVRKVKLVSSALRRTAACLSLVSFRGTPNAAEAPAGTQLSGDYRTGSPRGVGLSMMYSMCGTNISSQLCSAQ